MKKNKFGLFIMLGAITGAAISLFDRTTREQVTSKSKSMVDEVSFYAKNPTVLKSKFKDEANKYRSIYEQLTDDASFVKEKVGEIKQLSPQVKELVTDAKENLVEAKEDYQTIIKEGSTDEPLGK